MCCIRALLGIAAAAAVASAVAQQPVPFGELLAAASQQLSTGCERALEPRNSANAQREARMSAVVFCDCMPPASRR